MTHQVTEKGACPRGNSLTDATLSDSVGVPTALTFWRYRAGELSGEIELAVRNRRGL
jgi:hypothetical protein